MPARIEDVAAHSGVSIKTVSRVINGHPNVREKLRVRVEASIKALHYVPNPSARSLAGNRSHLVGLLYDNPLAGSSYIMELIVGVLQACESTAYNPVLHPFDSKDDLIAAVDGFIAQNRPDALVLVPPHANNVELLRRLDQLDVRYATISSKLGETRIDVGFDERRAAADIVEHLLALGHRRIGHIAGLKGHGAHAWRLAGYRDALRDGGIEYDKALVTGGDFTFASGVAGGRQLLDLPDPPTAIFAANDEMACGVIRVAHERKLRVPRELSVCGFDGIHASLLVSPELATVQQPCREMARSAVELVLRAIREPSLRKHLRIPYRLHLRESTAQPGRVARSRNVSSPKKR
ncbi:MAG: LacI family DNA-binding transcriptional regulator [Rudaea sp.]|uniref:LacI family DNA-binding transcriptional regulator n=1 Tax=Rudaea sp. TaxID=2136325 RepID=UPI0039E686E9